MASFSSALRTGSLNRHHALLAAVSTIHYFWKESTPAAARIAITQSEAGDPAGDAAGDAAGAANTDIETDDVRLFERQCLKRQLRQPTVPYPAWDYNWDGRMTAATSLEGVKQGLHRRTAARGTTRHVILVRHGQYDETSEDDAKRKLTLLGRLQAVQTGKRLRELMEGSQQFDRVEHRGPCRIKAIHVSNMLRAKETAALIAQELGGTTSVSTPDTDLNEALPAPMIPIRPDITGATEEIDANHQRIERAFLRYFWRHVAPNHEPNDDDNNNNNNNDDMEDEHEEEEQHEYEIVVCHGNIIRYFFCRALQLPPEAWLRFSTYNCSLTYLMIRPTGSVSCRMLGDVGHLKYDESTFSGYHGFKW